MPDWTYSTTSGTNMDTDFYVTIPSIFQVEQEYQECIQQRQQEERMWEQQWAEQQARMQEEKRLAEELREDRRKYPLFFLKEGIIQ